MSKIKLRALSLNDLSLTLKWHNDPGVSDWYLGHPFPVNELQEKQWYDKILASNYPVTVFGIEHCESGHLIGLTLLKEINLINRSAEFAIYIGDADYRGKGLSAEACRETLSFGFLKLGLNRVFLKVLAGNEPAIKLYQRIGFVQEGTLRKSVFKNGMFLDELLFSMLKSEYNEL